MDEFEQIEQIVDDHNKICNNKILKLYNTNPERDFVVNNNKRYLWHCAGVNACNIGVEYGLKNDYKYFFHLDDDDFWTEHHIAEHVKAYEKHNNCVFVVSKSTYLNKW